MKILYVEDNDDNIYMLKNRLTRAGFTVADRDRRRAGRGHGGRRAARPDPDGPEPAGARRLGGDAADQGRAGRPGTFR